MTDIWLPLTVTFGGVLLIGGLAAWAVIATEPARRVAWIADCQRHEMTAEQCAFLYRVDSQRRGEEAANMALMLNNLSQQTPQRR